LALAADDQKKVFPADRKSIKEPVILNVAQDPSNATTFY
jgi:hypothetical protein